MPLRETVGNSKNLFYLQPMGLSNIVQLLFYSRILCYPTILPPESEENPLCTGISVLFMLSPVSFVSFHFNFTTTTMQQEVDEKEKAGKIEAFQMC